MCLPRDPPCCPHHPVGDILKSSQSRTSSCPMCLARSIPVCPIIFRTWCRAWAAPKHPHTHKILPLTSPELRTQILPLFSKGNCILGTLPSSRETSGGSLLPSVTAVGLCWAGLWLHGSSARAVEHHESFLKR